jgi:HEPN domain-containing protein
MTLNEEAVELFLIAKDDSETCVFLLHANTGHRTACFLAQQAAEKFIKSALTQHGIRFPLTHDLAELAQLANNLQLSIPVDMEFLQTLNPYAVEIRYYLPQEIVCDFKKIITAMQSLLDWCQTIVYPEHSPK